MALTPLSELNGSFNLICANILHDVLVELAPALVAKLAPQGQLGLTLQQAVYEEDWVALLLRAQ